MALSSKARYGEVDDFCLDSYGKGSMSNSFSQRNAEADLLMGALDFFEERAVGSRSV